MNNYIEIELEPTKSGIGGSFITTASFKLDNVIAPFKNITVKIDTGCSISTIPLARFQALKLFCDHLKENDINNGIPYQISYGVETGGLKHVIPKSFDEKMACDALKFEHNVSGLEIGGIPISHNKIFVNYNRRGNILIGMDILCKWDIHIGESDVDGRRLLLGCPKERINVEYIDALQQNFGYLYR